MAGANDSASDASAPGAAPSSEPAHFSEVAPVIDVAPHEVRPTASDYATHGASALWPKFFGATLALGGLLLVFLALRMRPENDG